MADYIYTMYRVDKFYGADRQVLANISLSFLPGAKIGVLGPNGAGKSTVLRIMAGARSRRAGVAELAPGATVGLLEQEPRPRPGQGRARQRRGRRARAARPARPLQRRSPPQFAEPDADFDALLAEQAKVQDADRPPRRLVARRARSTARWTRSACPTATATSTTLSGGERRRVALCRLLLSSPDLLLLDEPTNHLDAESVAWLERFLADYKGTVVAVTHDRYFLDNVAGWILELDRGKGHPVPGQLLLLARAEAGRGSRSRRRPSRPAAARSRASSSGCA